MAKTQPFVTDCKHKRLKDNIGDTGPVQIESRYERSMQPPFVCERVCLDCGKVVKKFYFSGMGLDDRYYPPDGDEAS